MSIAFYDVFEPEAEASPAAAPEGRYRVEVILDSRGLEAGAITR
jgi:hypothetical protein